MWKMIRSCGEAYQVRNYQKALYHYRIVLTRASCGVAHKIYGVPQTSNTANYVYFLAYKELFALRGDKRSEKEGLDEIVKGEPLHHDPYRI